MPRKFKYTERYQKNIDKLNESKKNLERIRKNLEKKKKELLNNSELTIESLAKKRDSIFNDLSDTLDYNITYNKRSLFDKSYLTNTVSGRELLDDMYQEILSENEDVTTETTSNITKNYEYYLAKLFPLSSYTLNDNIIHVTFDYGEDSEQENMGIFKNCEVLSERNESSGFLGFGTKKTLIVELEIKKDDLINNLKEVYEYED